MGQKKLIRFEAIKNFENVLEYPENMQGKWVTHFNNSNHITLELACGKGEYTVALAQLFPNNNFIGVDIKGNRIYIGAKKCINEKIYNAAFLRTQIGMLPKYFAANEVNEIWITFPDPQLRLSKAKKRLTHPAFLRLYKQVLVPGGFIHLKTDSPVLYNFTKQVIEMYNITVVEDYNNVYEQTDNLLLKIKTHYESLDIAQSNRIFYLKFTLPNNLPNRDEELQQLLNEIEKPNEQVN